MSARRPPWSVLGLDPGADAGAIRKAYAARLKAIDPDSDPAGFARLREAREVALQLARMAQAPAEPDPLPEFADEPAPAGSWPYAAPDFAAGPAGGDPALTVSMSPGNEARLNVPGATFNAAGVVPPGPSIADPFTAVVVPGTGPQPAPTIASLPQPDKRLHALLFANEAEVALDEGELATAQECLHRVLQDAAQADLARHDAIEGWLADLLAESWPRSAPLLAPTVQGFGWDVEAGKISERPAIAFLNARARGYRFQDAVLDRKHIYHKAWMELQRPGRRDFLSRFRASRSDVGRLLTGIRRNFPELEQHLDPERVASWESPRLGGFRINPGVLALVVVMAIRIMISLSQPTQPPVPVKDPPELLAKDASTVDAAVAVAFGPGHNKAWLEQHEPELAQVIVSNTRIQRGVADPGAKIAKSTVDIVRQRLLEARFAADGALFERIMRLRLALMQAAQHAGPDACHRFEQTSLLDPVVKPLSAATRRREQALAVEMAESGRLGPIARPASRSAMVPGELVGQVIDVTHLSPERVRAAMQHKGRDADSCAVTVALLAATLDYSGKERSAILKTL